MLPRRYPIALMLLLVGLSGCADPYIESTTDLESSSDSTGPYRVRTVIVGSFSGDTVDLMYNPTDSQPQRYIPLRMDSLDEDERAGELFAADIPGQPAGTTIRYYVRVLRDDETVAESPVGGDLRPFQLTIVP
ncbi:MAG: hypothetical protein GY811_09235 [Myxococcales bacterium]|nr:hypothetical protein [Myxococcales bacterium]